MFGVVNCRPMLGFDAVWLCFLLSERIFPPCTREPSFITKALIVVVGDFGSFDSSVCWLLLVPKSICSFVEKVKLEFWSLLIFDSSSFWNNRRRPNSNAESSRSFLVLVFRFNVLPWTIMNYNTYYLFRYTV